MGKETNISWCDSTFNSWQGCTEVSPGCDNCYARVLDARWGGVPHWGKGVARKIMSDAYWKQPLKWNKAAQAAGVKHKVFCASMADVMDDEAPDGQRERLWELIDQTPNLIWQLLTKRPHRYMRYLPKTGFANRNVWLGCSAENQPFYEIRWPILRLVGDEYNCTTFISYEPALGPLSIEKTAIEQPADGHPDFPDWIICGAESGNDHRPMEQAWVEELQEEARNAGVAFFMKQFGARTPEQGAQLIPAHLLVRQFPGGIE